MDLYDLPCGRRLAVAARPSERLLGLLPLRDLPPGDGLLLPRTRSVHTIGMRFALDLLWIDAGGRVVRRDAGVGPFRQRACRAASGVLEVTAGAGEDWSRALSNHVYAGVLAAILGPVDCHEHLGASRLTRRHLS